MTITYENFEETYKPQKNPFVQDSSYDGCMFETYGVELAHVREQDIKNIWTLIDGENDNWYIVPGYSIVDRFGYFICEIPWESEEIEVDDNEHIKIKDAVEVAIKFSISIKKTLNEAGLDDFYFNKFEAETITVGDAKYALIDYLESLDINLTSEQEDELHNFYSQL